jgi:hypothetical protein
LWDLVSNKQGIPKSGSERFSEGRVYSELDDITTEGRQYCEQLSDQMKVHWHEISEFLAQDYPHHYAQLCSEHDNDGFVRVGSKGGSYFKIWKHCHDLRKHNLYSSNTDNNPLQTTARQPRAMDELLAANSNIWDFSERERNLLLRYWASQLRQKWIDKLMIRAEDHHELQKDLRTLQSEYKRRVLESAEIVGLTTTGLAQHISLLEKLKPKVLICEEAGEVLEVSYYTI